MTNNVEWESSNSTGGPGCIRLERLSLLIQTETNLGKTGWARLHGPMPTYQDVWPTLFCQGLSAFVSAMTISPIKWTHCQKPSCSSCKPTERAGDDASRWLQRLVGRNFNRLSAGISILQAFAITSRWNRRRKCGNFDETVKLNADE